jgi:hypothetical protein
MAKYDPLKEFLRRQRGSTITMTFTDVSELVGGLPNSAHRHPAWWANDNSGSHVHAQAWIAAGWRVEAFNVSRGTVVFTRDGTRKS